MFLHHRERRLCRENARWLMTFSLLVIFGCGAAQVAPYAVELGVGFSRKGIKRCSGYSPEMKVSGIPTGTNILQEN